MARRQLASYVLALERGLANRDGASSLQALWFRSVNGSKRRRPMPADVRNRMRPERYQKSISGPKSRPL